MITGRWTASLILWEAMRKFALTRRSLCCGACEIRAQGPLSRLIVALVRESMD